MNQLIGGSAVASVGLLRVGVYESGVDFRFAIEWNDPNLVTDAHEFGMGPRTPTDTSLKLGLRYADGRQFTTIDGPMAISLGLPTGLRQDITWWMPALPPVGPVQVFCEWSAAGISSSSITLAAERIHEAARIAPVRWTLPR